MNKRGQENSVNTYPVLLYEFDGLEAGVLKFNDMTVNVVVCYFSDVVFEPHTTSKLMVKNE